MNTKPTLITEEVEAAQMVFINKVYNWMALALLITGLTSWGVASSETLIYSIISNQFLFYGLLIGELLLVGYLSGAIDKMTPATAVFLFLMYSCLNGLTLSIIFLVYTSGSIATTFFICGGTFAVMSLYGFRTKTDLTKIGNLAFMALIGIILASIANFFMKSEILYWVVTYLGVAIFVGLIAYDTQKIKRMSQRGFYDEESEQKGAVLGALAMYLDFINLFLFLLRIFGRRK